MPVFHNASFQKSLELIVFFGGGGEGGSLFHQLFAKYMLPSRFSSTPGKRHTVYMIQDAIKDVIHAVKRPTVGKFFRR